MTWLSELMAESQSSKTDREREREKKGHHDSTVPTSPSLSPAGFIGEDVAITHRQNKQPNVNFSKEGTTTSRERDCARRHRITINGNLILFLACQPGLHQNYSLPNQRKPSHTEIASGNTLPPNNKSLRSVKRGKNNLGIYQHKINPLTGRKRETINQSVFLSASLKMERVGWQIGTARCYCGTSADEV